MRKHTFARYGKRTAARIRSIRRRAAAWRRQARRAVTLALISAQAVVATPLAHAQGVGQVAMAPGAGIVNRAVGALQSLNQNGPGYMYYGINGADRGLGYNGSYMTLGGFIPYAEDDMGGFWAADLRGHLSEYGGFFSNVGFVRKQFLGGSLLGVGVYWDYDGDLNQYPGYGTCSTPFGQFGHTYNQVGVSAEWLTDFGNVRSNGYMPVGTTGYAIGSPNTPFYQNFVMCQYGLDTALTGTDLEIGAYVPGLSDWAGMISVGGYALGNSRYNWSQGPQAGQDIVPWFGGVYTRLDLSILENWDFSLQYNNDSYFDSTGFARITYRMGGSRRRNVPDQMEQPMMRNEHIVRAHQTPTVAVNPNNADIPWRVIHVDNSNTGSGTGTAANPFTTLEDASNKATNPWDIVFVHQGLSRSTTPYGGTFTFGAANQSLVGDGMPFIVNGGSCCGPENLATMTGLAPLLSNPAGASIVAAGPGAAGATIANLAITGSKVGIRATGPMTSADGRNLSVSDVTIAGNGTSSGQTGVLLSGATGTAIFSDTAIANMTEGGFVVQGGAPDVEYQGSITSDTASNGGIAGPLISITDTTGGTIQLAVGGAPSNATVPNAISDTGGTGIQIANSQSTIAIGNVSLTNNTSTAINLLNDNSTVTISADSGSGIDKDTAGAAINVAGGAPVFNYQGQITNQQGNILHVNGTAAGSVTLTSPTGSPFIDNGDGILVENSAGAVTVLGAQINSQQEGILVQNSSGVHTFNDISIIGAVTAGVSLLNNTGTDQFKNLTINTSDTTGFLANVANNVFVTGASSVTTTGAPAALMTDVANANVSFTSVSATDSTGNGLLLDNVAGIFTATTVVVDNSQASGFVVRNSTGLDVLVGKATITTAAAPGSNGIEVLNSTSPASGAIEFTSVDITTGQGTGLYTSASDLVRVGSGTITATGGAAIDSSGSNLDVRLTSMSSTNSSTNGVTLVGTSGSVSSNQTTITTPAGVGINLVDNVFGLTADLGVTTVSNPGSIGVNIANTVSPAPTILTSFDSLNVTTTNATGFQAINGGTVNFNSPAVITATGGPAVVIENTTGTTNLVIGSGFTFGTITSTNSTSNGVALRNLNSNFTVQGTTTITGAGAASVHIVDTQSPAGIYDVRFNTVDIAGRGSIGLEVDSIGGQVIVQTLVIDNTANASGPAASFTNTSVNGGRVYVNSGTISDSNNNAFFIENSIAAIANATISSPFANAVLVQSNAGDISTVSITGGTYTGAATGGGTGTGIDGVLMQASGGGIINATILQNSFDVVVNPVEAIVLDAPSQILVNAVNNFGNGGGPPTTGTFVLNNAGGGVLGISQASIGDMTTTNTGVAVTPTGVITFNSSVPTPPPQTPP